MNTETRDLNTLLIQRADKELVERIDRAMEGRLLPEPDLETYRVQCGRCGTIRDAQRGRDGYAPACDCGACHGTAIR